MITSAPVAVEARCSGCDSFEPVEAVGRVGVGGQLFCSWCSDARFRTPAGDEWCPRGVAGWHRLLDPVPGSAVALWTGGEPEGVAVGQVTLEEWAALYAAELTEQLARILGL